MRQGTGQIAPSLLRAVSGGIPRGGGTGRKGGQRIGRRDPLYRKVMNDCKLFHKPFMRIAFVLYNGVV